MIYFASPSGQSQTARPGVAERGSRASIRRCLPLRAGRTRRTRATPLTDSFASVRVRSPAFAGPHPRNGRERERTGPAAQAGRPEPPPTHRRAISSCRRSNSGNGASNRDVVHGTIYECESHQLILPRRESNALIHFSWGVVEAKRGPPDQTSSGDSSLGSSTPATQVDPLMQWEYLWVPGVERSEPPDRGPSCSRGSSPTLVDFSHPRVFLLTNS